MVEESQQDLRPSDAELERWAEVARGRAPPPGPHPLSPLFAPLEPAERDRMIDGALARVRVEEAAPRSRRASVVGGAIAAVLAMAAGLVLVLRAPAPSSGPHHGMQIEMHGRAELRSAGTDQGSDPGAPVELRLRNETGWVVRAEAPGVGSRLYLVAHELGRPLRRLEAPIDARSGAFRVRGEVGALGLEPGDVTVYFMVGPAEADAEALRVAQAAIDGQAPPAGWSIDARRLHIVE